MCQNRSDACRVPDTHTPDISALGMSTLSIVDSCTVAYLNWFLNIHEHQLSNLNRLKCADSGTQALYSISGYEIILNTKYTKYIFE